jgi:hypothetical protein
MPGSAIGQHSIGSRVAACWSMSSPVAIRDNWLAMVCFCHMRTCTSPGVSRARRSPRTALVSDPETVVARIAEYAALGIDTFILSGYPHLEEAYRVAELLLPRLASVRVARMAMRGGVAG